MNLDTPTPEKGEIVLQRSYCNDRVGNHLNGPSFIGQKMIGSFLEFFSVRSTRYAFFVLCVAHFENICVNKKATNN